MTLPKIKFIISKKEIHRELKRFVNPSHTENLIPYLKGFVKHCIIYFRKNYPEVYKKIIEDFSSFDELWPKAKKILLNDSEKFHKQWIRIEEEVLSKIKDLFFHWKSKNIYVYLMWAIFCPYSQQDGIRMVIRYKGYKKYESDTLIHELIHQNFYDHPHRFTDAEIDAVHACIFLAGWRIAKDLKLPTEKALPFLEEKERRHIKKLKPYFNKYLKSKNKDFMKWFKEIYPKVKIK